MNNPKATAIEPEELLKLQNLILQTQVATLQREAFEAVLVRKYGAADNESLSINGNGSITRIMPTPVTKIK